MSVFSNQLFISPERPVDPFTLSILELIDRLLRDAKIRYMPVLPANWRIIRNNH